MRGGSERIGPYTYRWGPDCFPVTADSLELGEFVKLKAGDRVLDLGCGAGLLLLLCAKKQPQLTFFGVEKAKNALQHALENMEENGIQAELYHADVRELELPGAVDVVVTNPPWFPPGNGADGGMARTEVCSLEEWLAVAAKTLRPKGKLAMVHHPARLADLLEAGRRNRLEPKEFQLLQQRRDTPPFGVLLSFTKNGNPGLLALPTRVLEE